VTVVVALIAASLAAWLAWLGWRRGALAMLLGLIPPALAGGVLLATLRTACANPNRFGSICLLGLAAALVTLLASAALLRAVRRRLDTGREGSARARRLLACVLCCNRIAGAALGVFYAAVLCLALACLGSTIPFAFSVAGRSPLDADILAPPPKWVTTLGRACCKMADVAHFTILDHVPQVGAYSREVRALVRLLNAPREKLCQLAKQRGWTELGEVPEVQEALLSKPYVRLVDRAARGDLTAIPLLADSPTTRKLLNSPQVRQLTTGLTPSELLRDLDQPPATGR
jgi:hypothetical protein